jgi:hypothetical protein
MVAASRSLWVAIALLACCHLDSEARAQAGAGDALKRQADELIARFIHIAG